MNGREFHDHFFCGKCIDLTNIFHQIQSMNEINPTSDFIIF